jgi:NADPH:quinone reductase-like Zn-dependent oxidoreductase
MRTIHIDRHGGPEVMAWTAFPDPTPGPGQAVVTPTAIGVNYMDIGAQLPDDIADETPPQG